MKVWKWFKSLEWRNYLIVSIIVSIGSLFIHFRYNSPPDVIMFFSYLPLAWLLVFVLMLGFTLLLGGNE